jgi:hypothetical protein
VSSTYIGRPCKRGYSGERHTANRACVVCAAKASTDFNVGYYQRNKNQLKAKSAERYKEKRKEIRTAQNEYGRKNRPLLTAQQQKWRDVNHEKYLEGVRRRYKNNPNVRAQVKQHTARRRASELKCTCCTKGHFRTVYDAAELIGGEVDHILALALGGLHCTKNLQILSVGEHKEKTKLDLAECRRQRAAKK